MKIEFVLNLNKKVFDVEETERALDFLREKAGIKSIKEGCGEGECGACAVLLDGRIINSCCFPLGNLNGHSLVTIEGFSKTKRYKALEEAFSEEGGMQCGFCTPGMIIAAESLLNKDPHPTEDAIRIGISGNLCRCTGYNMIVKAIKRASEKGAGLW